MRRTSTTCSSIGGKVVAFHDNGFLCSCTGLLRAWYMSCPSTALRWPATCAAVVPAWRRGTEERRRQLRRARHPAARRQRSGVGRRRWDGWSGPQVARGRGEIFFQRIAATYLANPLGLTPLDGVSTSGIGLEISRQLAQAGAHVVMAVRRPKVAHELIQKWQNEKPECSMPLNIEHPTKYVDFPAFKPSWIFKQCNGILPIWLFDPTLAEKDVEDICRA